MVDVTILEEVITASIMLGQAPEALNVTHGYKLCRIKKGNNVCFIMNMFMLSFGGGFFYSSNAIVSKLNAGISISDFL